MTQIRLCRALFAVLLAGLAGCGGGPSAEDPAAGGGDWPLYRGDAAGSGYSSLAQVNTGNVASLAQAWTYSLRAEAADAAAAAGGPRSQATPIVIDGVMYLPAADRVVALDPATGTEHWRHAVPDGRPVPARRRLVAGRRRHAAAHPLHHRPAPARH